MGRDLVKWRLFVDESGKFESPDDVVVAAGLLLRADVPGSSVPEARDALEAALPGVPWPIHASIINHPALLVLAAVARAADAPPPTWPSDVAAALERLRAARPEEVAAVLEQLRGGEAPGWSTLQALDEALVEADPALAQRLAGSVRAAHLAVGRVIGALAAAAPPGDAPAVMVLSSGECANGDASPQADPAADAGSRRYLTLLGCLLQRTVDVLARRAGRHELWIEVLSRPLVDPLLRRRVQMHVRHVGEVVRGLALPAGGRVRVVTAAVPFFDRRADPALVLADFVANRARPALRGRGRALAGVEATLTSLLGAPVRSGTPGASHLAASGAAQAAVDAVRRGTPVDPRTLDDPSLRRWACEQASEWIALLGPAS